MAAKILDSHLVVSYIIQGMVPDVEDADEEFLGRIARRHLGLPWAICETERLKIREIAEGDYEEIVENHVDAGLEFSHRLQLHNGSPA